MKFVLTINANGDSIASYEVTDGKHRIGSDPACELRLEHAEMSPVAASLEVSGDVAFLRNHSDFEIYVGTSPLGSGAVAEWRSGAVVQLTRSLSLSLATPDVVVEDGDEDAGASKKTQSLLQIAVIAICAVLAFWILATEEDPTANESDQVISFDELVAQYEQTGGEGLAKLRHQQLVDLTYLTEARALEKRWGKNGMDEARQAYELVLTSRPPRADLGENSLASLTRRFAASRIDALK